MKYEEARTRGVQSAALAPGTQLYSKRVSIDSLNARVCHTLYFVFCDTLNQTISQLGHSHYKHVTAHCAQPKRSSSLSSPKSESEVAAGLLAGFAFGFGLFAGFGLEAKRASSLSLSSKRLFAAGLGLATECYAWGESNH